MRLFKPKIFNIPSELVPTTEEVEKLDIRCLTINKDGRKRPKMTFEYTEKNNRFILRNHVKFVHEKKENDIIVGGKKILKKLEEIKGIKELKFTESYV